MRDEYYIAKRRVSRDMRKREARTAWRLAVLCWAVVLLLVILLSLSGCAADEAPEPTCSHELNPTVIVETVVYDTYAPWSVSDNHAAMLARLAWGEARGCSMMEQAAVMWCVLNRVESEDPQFPDTIEEVITQENQFYYSESFPLRQDLYWLALDVMARWLSEPYMMGESGRVLPKEYLWFSGDGAHNWFRTTYELSGSNWDWSLPDPYAGGLG